MKNLLTLILLFNFHLAYNQTFERVYGEEGRDEGYAVIESFNGNFFVCGKNHESLPFLLKTDTLGIEQWTLTYGTDEGEFSIIRKISEDLIVLGGKKRILTNGSYVNKPLIAIYDTEGSEMWSYNFTAEDNNRIFDIEIDEDEHIWVAIDQNPYTQDIPVEEDDFILYNFDSTGNLLTSHIHTDSLRRSIPYDLLLTEDGGYLTVGGIRYDTTYNSPLFVSKLNAEFETEWTFKGNWSYIGQESFFSGRGDLVVELEDGSFVIAYSAYDDAVIDGDPFLKLVTLSSTGQLEWDKVLFAVDYLESPSLGGGNYYLGNIQSIDNQTIIISGTTGFYWQSNSGGSLSLIKIDNEGNTFWENKFGIPYAGIDFGFNVQTCSDGGFVSTGFSSINSDYNSRQTYLVKTDNNGELIKNNLNGKLVFDINQNCQEEEDEIGLKNWLVTAVTEGNIYYDLTNEYGQYELNVDNGSYNMFVTAPNQYWAVCENLISTGELAEYDTLSNNFHVQPTIYCPQMRVDVSTPLLRRCFDTQYTISYSNEGTIPAENAYIEVTFDPFLEITSSSPTWTNQSGQTLTFDLNTVDPQQSGRIYVEVSVGCDEEGVELGQTHCVEAYIYPDTICAPPDPIWDGSDIIVDAQCEGDSIRFFIQNIGAGDMDAEREYIIIEDHIILLQEPFQLPSGEQIEIPVETEGIAYRMEAEQALGHPIGNVPSINVEGCNATDTNEFLVGFWNEYPEDDVANFVSIDCQSNIGSYDPNDKRAQPAGYGEESLIAPNTDIEYHIRFQNTGTDTAFTVVIEDVLSVALNISSIVPGASSHPYDFDINNGRKLVFTFNDIDLVDSTTNEVESHGFVKFRVSQMPDNPTEPWATRIYNSAKIFFDFNAPITTNFTLHKLGRHFIENYISSTYVLDGKEQKVLIQPNPFSEETTFTVLGEELEMLNFSLINTQGQKVHSEKQQNNSFIFRSEGLNKGLYFYQIRTKGQLLDTGKIIIK